MVNMLHIIGFLLIFAAIIGIILFTIFIFTNEKKLEQSYKKEELKRMYTRATFVSLCITIIGLIFILTAYFLEENVWWGSILFYVGIAGVVYSAIGYYNARHRKI